MNGVAEAVDLDWVRNAPSLDTMQAGSLNRILDLAKGLPDDWSGMLGRTTLQEDFGGLRFQLAYMSYALALTHVHRLPAAPFVFRTAFDSLIQKILSPDCWLYWHYVSTGNGPFNAALDELPAEWDPVAHDYIMYSAYVQSMALLYHYLFDDDKHDRPGALTFSINPLFWGAGGKHFAYDESSLNTHLYWNMVERGFLGIACEPNCVFQICNQPPILGFRFHDLIHGGDTAGEVTTGYLKAWGEFGIVAADGGFSMMVQERERIVITPPDSPWVDFWLGSLMHAWNPETVQQAYPQQMRRWSVQGPDGTLCIASPVPQDPAGAMPVSARDFGWAAVCASEVGDTDTLEQLLAYADRFLHPVWESGSYYFARHDDPVDANGNFSVMDPHTGNALLAYARLNVPGGLRQLYEGVWTSRRRGPVITGATRDADLRRAWYDVDRRALAIDLGERAEGPDLTMTVDPRDHGIPSLWRDGAPADQLIRALDGSLAIDIPEPASTSLVLQW